MLNINLPYSYLVIFNNATCGENTSIKINFIIKLRFDLYFPYHKISYALPS